jgi:hypothetical protein
MGTRLIFAAIFAWLGSNGQPGSNDTLRTMQYSGRPEEAAIQWQDGVRAKLTNLLKVTDLIQERGTVAFNPVKISSEDKGSYVMQEIEINSTHGRRMRIVLTMPHPNEGPHAAVVCVHGHGGKLYSVYESNSIYKGFASELAERGFVTISCMVSQHNIFEQNRTLMGERLWDLMRCVDFLETLPEVDRNRIGCAGLSLGGEMTMWLGALDTRISATLSSGFLTVMDQMEQNHCMCWNFPGLRRLVDFADIYSLIAPRPLVCQNGFKEPSDQFYVPLARNAFSEIQVIYGDLGRPENLALDVHKGAHEIDLPGLLCFFEKHLQ